MPTNQFKKAAFLLFGIALISSCQNEYEPIAPQNDADLPERVTTEVTIEEAQADLESLLADIDTPSSRNGNGTPRRIKNAFSLPIEESSSRSGDTVPLVHIFNFEDNQGYAIMSGDIRVPSLIAIAESGSITEDKEIDNPGMALFLEGMANCYMDDVTPDRLQPYEPSDPVPEPDYTVYGDWKNIVYKQYGYCPVKWGQHDPYNMYCPTKDNKKTLAGCVATSVAQLMAIYKYPSSYNGYTFAWDEMTKYATGGYCSSVGKDNIARLMQQLGLKNNLDMSYGTGGSGAQSENSVRTLKAFGYTNPGSYHVYDTDKVVSELKNGYAVLMSGYSHKKTTKILGIKVSTTYSNGHQWLAHGLLERRREVKRYSGKGVLLSTKIETQWYPLCNWGWNGSYDGYYLDKAFDSTKGRVFPDGEPSSRSSDALHEDKDGNFQYRLRVITGIRK